MWHTHRDQDEPLHQRSDDGSRRPRPIRWGIRDPFPDHDLRPVPDERRTTVLVCNLPREMTQETFKTVIDEWGFARRYNFL